LKNVLVAFPLVTEKKLVASGVATIKISVAIPLATGQSQF
jgi:uncharacterized membrane protein (DUF441 family)